MDKLRAEKVSACLAASKAARSRGDLTDAISHLSAAIYLRPAEPSLYVSRAELLLEACDFSTAIANLSKAVALTEVRDGALVASLAHALDARGLILVDEADYGGAVTVLGEAIGVLAPAGKAASTNRLAIDRALKQRKGHESASPSKEAGASADAAAERAHERAAIDGFHLHRALAFVGLNSTSAAVQDLQTITRGANASADALFLLARMELKAGALAASRAHLVRALETDRGHAQARSLFRLMGSTAQVFEEEAVRLMLLGHPAKAISNLTSAIALDPVNAGLFKRRALARKQAGQPLGAVADVEEAIRLSGGPFPEAERLLGAINNDAAIVEAAAGRLQSAVAHLDFALECDGTAARYLVNRADIACRLNDASRAMADYERARELCAPTSAHRDDGLAAEVERKIARLHYEAGARQFNRMDYERALQLFTRAAACDPLAVQYLLARAEVALLLKRWDTVRVDAQAAIALAPKDPRAREMLRRVGLG